MVSITRVTNGTYNLFATKDEQFTLQGNMDKEQLLELKEELDSILDYERRAGL